ncbi:MAG: hypothetical protein AB9921_02485 [Erysipelotrichaceae bacterium]
MAAITPSAKADLMDGVKNLFIVAMGIALFMPMLYIVLSFNDAIIVAIRNLAPVGNSLGLADGGGAGGLVSVIIQIAFLFVLLSLNITYLVRAVTLALLIGFSPLFIALFAAGPASQKISTTWLKELVSNLLMQAFNAAILLLFAVVSTYGTLTVLERFALLISFIPLTKFFRTSLMNLGSGSDAVAERTGGSLTNMVGALTAGALMSRFDGKSEKNGKVVEDGKAAPQQAQTYSPVNGENETKASKESLKGRLDGFADKAQTIGKNALKPAELARMAGKGAAIAGGFALSAGSAATGGNPILGNAAVLKGGTSMLNQMEGWGIKDEVDAESPMVLHGSELTDSGFGGISDDVLTFSSGANANINETPESKASFHASVERYNLKPENLTSPAEVLFNDDKSKMVGVRIPGVSGKTRTIKDGRGKPVFSESTIYGQKKFNDFKGHMNGFKTAPAKPEEAYEAPEDNHNNNEGLSSNWLDDAMDGFGE